MEYRESFEYDIHHSSEGRSIGGLYVLEEEIYRSEQSIITKIQAKNNRKSYVLKAIKKKEGIVIETAHLLDMAIDGVNKVVEIYESDLFIYVIEPYIEGLNLDQYIKMHGPMVEEKARAITMKILHILSRLHDYENRHYVFRDLKPSNIMMNDAQEVCLIDIITIREIKESQSQDTFLVGSRGYTAPEAYGYMQTTEKSDVYSVGATLFFLLTGIQPYSISSYEDKLKEMSGLSRFTYRIILKATAFNPNDRYESVAAMLSDMTGKKSRRLCWIITAASIAIVLTASIWYGVGQQANLISQDDELVVASEMKDVMAKTTDESNNPSESIVLEDTDIVEEVPVEGNSGAANDREAVIDGETVMTQEIQNSVLLNGHEGLTDETVEGETRKDVKDEEIVDVIDKSEQEITQPNVEEVISVENLEEVVNDAPISDDVLIEVANTVFDIKNIHTPDDYDMSSVIRLYNGIGFKDITQPEEEFCVQMSVDQLDLSQCSSEVIFLCYGTSAIPFNEEDMPANFYNATVMGRGLQVFYPDTWYSSVFNDLDQHLFMAFYSAQKEPLAYYIYNNVRQELEGNSSGIGVESIPDEVSMVTETTNNMDDSMGNVSDLMVDSKVKEWEISEGIKFYYTDYNSEISIDSSIVPEFSRISVWSYDQPIPDVEIELVRSQLSKNPDWSQYYYNHGMSFGPGPGSVFEEEYWLVALVNENDEVVLIVTGQP